MPGKDVVRQLQVWRAGSKSAERRGSLRERPFLPFSPRLGSLDTQPRHPSSPMPVGGT